MQVIIAEKPSVAREIAAIVGATNRKDGFIEGNGYAVTWAFGHLVGLAMPQQYGIAGFRRENLPILPSSFILLPRQVREGKEYKADPGVVKQLGILRELFGMAERIIVATDAGREGELIFRYIYSYLECRTPFVRLWISSLTDRAIREGLQHLRPGNEYDNLYLSAKARSEADWIVGINASQALAVAAGRGVWSLGRVQTPTLAMICARFKENREFVPTDYWQLSVTLKKGDDFRQFRHVENIPEKTEADRLYDRITTDSMAAITKTERKRGFQAPPLLYDLTALQKDCNVHLDLSAEKTLAVAQSLYEKKLISYPRTGSRYIPDDVMRQVPDLLRGVIGMKEFREYGGTLDWDNLSTRSVNAGKVTDHHALIVTGVQPVMETLTEQEQAVYRMIAGRMLEAFSPVCEKETLVIEAAVDGLTFRSHSVSVVKPGWRAVFNRSEDKENDEETENKGTARFDESETVPVSGRSLAKKKTMPKPLYTEATLLAAMESCGKELADEEAREAMKELGIGTPATRAAVIATLFKREYVERSGKALVPTDKGMAVYEAVRKMRVADVELTGSWEKTLMQIERHKLSPETFMRSISVYARQVTEEVLSIRFPETASGGIVCPKCGKGKIILRQKLAKCNNEGCGLLVFRRFLNKELTDQHLAQLFSSGTTKLIKGFKGKKGTAFDAALAFDKEYNVTLSFPKPQVRNAPKQSGRKNTGRKSTGH